MNSEHYLKLTIDPHARYDWDKLRLVDPLTHQSVSLAEILAAQIQTRGEYLVKVSIDVNNLIAQELPMPDIEKIAPVEDEPLQ